MDIHCISNIFSNKVPERSGMNNHDKIMLKFKPNSKVIGKPHYIGQFRVSKETHEKVKKLAKKYNLKINELMIQMVQFSLDNLEE